jgi:hypothetical protein
MAPVTTRRSQSPAICATPSARIRPGTPVACRPAATPMARRWRVGPAPRCSRMPSPGWPPPIRETNTEPATTLLCFQPPFCASCVLGGSLLWMGCGGTPLARRTRPAMFAEPPPIRETNTEPATTLLCFQPPFCASCVLGGSLLWMGCGGTPLARWTRTAMLAEPPPIRETNTEPATTLLCFLCLLWFSSLDGLRWHAAGALDPRRDVRGCPVQGGHRRFAKRTPNLQPPFCASCALCGSLLWTPISNEFKQPIRPMSDPRT